MRAWEVPLAGDPLGHLFHFRETHHDRDTNNGTNFKQVEPSPARRQHGAKAAVAEE